MKYYSDELKKIFDTEKELKEAEEKFALERKEKEAAIEIKKAEAAKIKDALRELIEAKKEAEKIIKEKEEKYYKFRNEFIKKYGSYHFTYTDEDEGIYVSDFFDSISSTLKDFFGW